MQATLVPQAAHASSSCGLRMRGHLRPRPCANEGVNEHLCMATRTARSYESCTVSQSATTREPLRMRTCLELNAPSRCDELGCDVSGLNGPVIQRRHRG